MASSITFAHTFSEPKELLVKVDRSQVIGFALLFGIFLVWSMLNKPSRQQMLERQRIQDSIALAHKQALPGDTSVRAITGADTSHVAQPDSAQPADLAGRYGIFAAAAHGEVQSYVLENDKMRITFSNRGGRITEVLLKDYKKITLDEHNKEHFEPLKLLEDPKNVFEYLIPTGDKVVRSGELYFTATEQPGTITFTATGSNGAAFIETYKISADGYSVDYNIGLEGIPNSANHTLKLNWVNYLDKIEKNANYERFYTSVYYRELASDSPDYCSCRRSDTEDVQGKPLKWVSHANQFFNSSLIADDHFDGGVMSTEMLDNTSDDLKVLHSEISIPLAGTPSEHIGMTMYMGPNDFERLRAFNVTLEDVIPFGRSIFGTINRWVIRPLFNVLSSVFANKGLVILLLTLIVKLLLYPLTFKMLHSQAKMGALKPQLAKLREKFKDDTQKQQLETMKVYREYGVSPLGGCLPMVLQMPIWFALYRFFPASIEFRQAGFLWANDLSSYDVFANLPYDVPFYGSHVSLFTLLWAGTTILYTYYNMKNMDMGTMNNPFFKYMQYFMPVMFLFFFNNYASGLTLYLLFSNMLNIALTLGTRQFIFNEEKIRAELALNKAKPKKRSSFSQRLEQAMKEQQNRGRQKTGK